MGLTRTNEEIAKRAADMALSAYTDDVEDNDMNDESLLNKPVQPENEVEMEVKLEDAFDIFSDVGEPRYQKGDTVKYIIKKNNEVQGHRNHPYSWEKVQEEFGGGNFTIVAKSNLGQKKYIRSQTMQLAAIDSNPQKNATKSNDLSIEILKQMQETLKTENERRDNDLKMEKEKIRQDMKDREEKIMQEQQKNQSLMETLIGNILKPKDNSHEMRSLQDEIKNSNNQMATIMLGMMQMMNKPADNKDEKILEMIMKLEERRQNEAREARQEALQREEKIRLEMKELMEKVVNSQVKEKDPFEVIKFYKDAEKEGFERAKMIEELASIKADEKGGESESEDKSITGALIKNLAPMLPYFLQAHQQMPNNPPLREISHPVDNTRRLVRPPQTTTATSQIHKGNEGKGQKLEQTVQAGRSGSGQNHVELAQQENKDIIENERAQIEAMRVKVIEIIGPEIVKGLLNESGPISAREASRNCSRVLIQTNINPLNAIALFSEDVMLKMAGSYGLSDHNYPGIETWLKDFYDNFKEEATTAIREYTESQSHQTV